MQVYMMNTEQGGQIPFLRIHDDYTVETFVSYKGYHIFPEDSLIQDDCFKATYKSLLRLLEPEYDLPRVIFNRPDRKVTLPGGMMIGISPLAEDNIIPSSEKWAKEQVLSYEPDPIYNPSNEPFGSGSSRKKHNRCLLLTTSTDVIDKDNNPNNVFLLTQLRGDGAFYAPVRTYVENDEKYYKQAILAIDKNNEIIPLMLTRTPKFDGNSTAYIELTIAGGPNTPWNGWNNGESWVYNPWYETGIWQQQTGDLIYISNQEQEPEPESNGIIDLSNRFSPRLMSNGIGAYPLNKEQLHHFFNDLWSTNIAESIWYGVAGDPTDSILSLTWFPSLKEHLNQSERFAYLQLGAVSFKGLSGDESIITQPLLSEYAQFTCGSVTIPNKYNNFLDLTQSKVSLYIPFVGYVALDVVEIMGKEIRLDYNFNLVTSASVAYVYVKDGKNWRIAYELPCTVGIPIPVSVSGVNDIMNNFTRLAGSAIGAGVGMAAGSLGSGLVALGVANNSIKQDATIFTQGLMNELNVNNLPQGDVKRSGGINSESGSVGKWTPHVLIERPISLEATDYTKVVGKPDHRSMKMSSLSGYVKIGAIDSSALNIPHDALNEIVSLLKGGVYID